MADVFEKMMKRAEEAGFNDEIRKELDELEFTITVKEFGETIWEAMAATFGLPFVLEHENEIALACSIAINILNEKSGFYDKSKIIEKLGLGGDTKDEPEGNETV